jgi:dipeptidase D
MSIFNLGGVFLESILGNCEPKEVFSYFETLCSIPHGSRNTKAVSDWCVAFAAAHQLRCIQDENNNIIIFKCGSKGREEHPTVILQGHLDMVCEKESDCDIDFLKNGLRLATEDGKLYAKGTTLGGDDGIAVAMALAILASNDLPHPPLEVIFTVDEEIGMLGAAAIDLSEVKGRTLLNLDSEDEGILTVSCAGGATSRITLPVQTHRSFGQLFRLQITGLQGGHSGAEIHKGRGNANKMMAALLNEIASNVPISLAALSGGKKDNAIPRSSTAEVLLSAEAEADFVTVCREAIRILRAENLEKEPKLEITMEPLGMQDVPVIGILDTMKVTELLCELPNGVQKMSAEIQGLVQTSLNLGILLFSDEAIELTFSVRSSVNAEKEALIHSLKWIAGRYGASYAQSGDYPAWEYRKDSPLRNLMVRTFCELYGYTPKIEAIHAGLECGILSDKLPGLDAVSIGPDMEDIHTTREKLSIASVQRTWDYVCAILKEL